MCAWLGVERYFVFDVYSAWTSVIWYTAVCRYSCSLIYQDVLATVDVGELTRNPSCIPVRITSLPSARLTNSDSLSM